MLKALLLSLLPIVGMAAETQDLTKEEIWQCQAIAWLAKEYETCNELYKGDEWAKCAAKFPSTAFVEKYRAEIDALVLDSAKKSLGEDVSLERARESFDLKGAVEKVLMRKIKDNEFEKELTEIVKHCSQLAPTSEAGLSMLLRPDRK